MAAAFEWQPEKSVADWLFAEPYGFDFFQAVKLLELMYPADTPVGEGFDPEKEPVHFRARVSFDFPASDVQDLETCKDHPRARMTTNFLGLAGATGPLPTPLVELLLERLKERDTGIRDFLDIFNHRLISLMYRTRKIHRVTLASETSKAASIPARRLLSDRSTGAATPRPAFRAGTETPLDNYLYAFLGLGLAGLRNRMLESDHLEDRALLPYTGLLNQRPRSVVGLEQILSDHFRTPVCVEQLLGLWRTIEPEQLTMIGMTGKNQILGQSIVLGNRIWDQQGRFCLVLGPLKLETFENFLPDGNAYKPLCAMTRFYAGEEFEFRVRLKIKAAEIPELHLRARGPGQAKLGWTTWLRTRPNKEDSEIEVSSEAAEQVEQVVGSGSLGNVLFGRAGVGG
jgi:type VI secretion system protein ImpH